MIDNTIPTSQFHPYTPPDVTPHSENVAPGGLRGLLSRAGIGGTSVRSMGEKFRHVDVRHSLDKARTIARSNAGLTLGGLALAAIGAGLLRRRASMR